MKLYSKRAGELYSTGLGYDCFVPCSLYDVKIEYDTELINLLTEASRNLGILDNAGATLPDKDIFISMYVEKESLLSSQIEGTQATLSDVLQRNKIDSKKRKDIEDVVNYVHTLNSAIDLLDKLPISGRFLKELHKILLKGVRGENKNPGEMRRSQNWIGPNGCTLNDCSFVPPSVDKMNEAFSNLEKYINDDLAVNPLVKIALIHYQFETIHPFLDGNGRIGRIIIPVYLKSVNLLNNPLLYLSLYLKKNQYEYYSLLMDVRFKGEYERWIKFFLKGIIETSDNSIKTINLITNLVDSINKKVELLNIRNIENYKKTITYIFKHPYFDSTELKEYLNVSKPTVLTIIQNLINLEIIEAIDNKQRYVNYKFSEYVDILEEGCNI